MYGARVETPDVPASRAARSCRRLRAAPLRDLRQGRPALHAEQIAVHTHCKLAVLDPMLAAYRGEQ
jgi:hypothetical protein